MVHSLNYHKNSVILETWNIVRQLENYQEVAGSRLYRKFFKKHPAAKKLFGFAATLTDEELMKSRSFLQQSSLYITLLDTVVDMLGPDIEMLTEILKELGDKHYRMYGVNAEMYAPMGEALVETLTELLGEDKFGEETQNIFLEIWVDMANDMTESEMQERKKLEAKLAAKKQEQKLRRPSRSSTRTLASTPEERT